MATTPVKRAAILFSLAISISTPFAQAQERPVRSDVHGDPLPAQVRARLGTLRWRHGGAVTFVTHTPDGKHLITDSQDNTLRLWDLSSGVEVRRFLKDEVKAKEDDNALGVLAILRSAANGAALAPNGKTLAAGFADGSIMIWDVGSGKVLGRVTSESAIAHVVFSPDSELLVSKDANQVLRVWDVAATKELRTLGEAPPNSIRGLPLGALTGVPTFLPNGDVMSLTLTLRGGETNSDLKRWDLVTGRERTPIRLPLANNEFVSFAYSSDSKRFASAGIDGTVRLWDLTSAKELHSLEGLRGKGFASQLAFTPDGKTLAATASDQTLRFWDVGTGKETSKIGEPTGPQFMGMRLFGSATFSNLSFSADGKQVVVGTNNSTIRRFDVASGKEIDSADGHRGIVVTLAVAPNGKTALTRGSDRTAHLWDLGDGKEVRHFALPGDVTQAAFAPDGQSLALGTQEGALMLWDVQSGKELRKWQAGGGGFAALAFAPDGKTLASRGYARVIHLWDPATGKELRQIAEPAQGEMRAGEDLVRSFFAEPVANLCFGADGTTLAVMPPLGNPVVRVLNGRGGDGVKPAALLLFDTATGKLLRKCDDVKSGISAFAYAPDGRTLATANSDGSILLWEAMTGKPRLEVRPTQARAFTVLTFSPDSRVLAGSVGAEIHLWNSMNGQELGKFTGHHGGVTSLSFTPDGKSLLSGSADTTALLWNVERMMHAAKVPSAALEDGQAEALWNALAGSDPARAHQAAMKLMASPKPAVLLVQRHLKPIAPADAQKVARLLDELDSKEFAVRQNASAELEKLGELAEFALKQALAAGPGLERRQRLEQLQERLITLSTYSAEQLQGLRAVEVLERIGTAEAGELLRTLAKGAAGARLTRHAQAARDRLNKQ
ncbi:MAG: hypothetical protein K2R98_02950 [Gemmataceae bacterium]|nr:hypothetical protein [Gemmataceae bacterium]